jgi:zinc transport system permease protein
MSYLFGDVLYISGRDLWLLAGLDVLAVSLSLVFYNKLLAVCFDEEHAGISGVNVKLYHMMLMILIALSVVLLIQVVGVIMLIALLALPAAAAGQFAGRLWTMMVAAAGVSALCTTTGTLAAYAADLPAGPVIVLCSAAAYALALAARGGLRRLRAGAARAGIGPAR